MNTEKANKETNKTKETKVAKSTGTETTKTTHKEKSSSRSPKTPNTANLLKEIMDNHGMSINMLEKESDINKGVLSKILNCDVNMSTVNFQKLLSSLPFTGEEKKEFYISYYSEMYGQNVISSIEKIISQYNAVNDNQTSFTITKGLDAVPDGGFLNGKQNIYGAIYDITQNAEWVYTNFSFDYDGGVLDDYFYSLVSDESKELSLVHFIEFYKIDCTDENIKTYIRTLRYMNKKSFPVSLPSDKKVAGLSPLPFFVYSDNGLVFFGDDMGFLVSDKNALDAFSFYAKQLEKDAKPCGVHLNNLFELKNVTSASSTTKLTQYYSLQTYPCIVFFLSLDDIMAVANPEGKLDLPLTYEQQVQLFYAYYENYGRLIGKFSKSICSVEGLDDFALTGRFIEAPRAFSKPFSPEMRIHLLDRVAEMIEKDRAFVVDSKKLKIPQDISLCFDNAGVSFFGDADKDYVGSAFYGFVDTPQFITAFSLLPEYLVNCGYVYEKENALRYIENAKAIARCQITEK